jgi:hypothetical protein
LKLVLEDWTTPAPLIYIAYDSHRNISNKIRTFVDFVVECYPSEQCIVSPPANADLLDVLPVGAGKGPRLMNFR